jgi:hypothetical protein
MGVGTVHVYASVTVVLLFSVLICCGFGVQFCYFVLLFEPCISVGVGVGFLCFGALFCVLFCSVFLRQNCLYFFSFLWLIFVALYSVLAYLVLLVLCRALIKF